IHAISAMKWAKKFLIWVVQELSIASTSANQNLKKNQVNPLGKRGRQQTPCVELDLPVQILTHTHAEPRPLRILEGALPPEWCGGKTTALVGRMGEFGREGFMRCEIWTPTSRKRRLLKLDDG
ncbi:hypothetical protein U1Q18_015444, partial [Sarracenia purpurea var. burkii]